MAAINSTSRIPKHLQVAMQLKKRIEKGIYPAEKHLPPVRILGSEFGVSQNAVQRALRVLAKEGVVQPQRSVGVRVLPSNQNQKTPLTFGMVYPFSPDAPFAGTIHSMAEKAIDYQNNYCLIKGSDGDAKKERDILEHFLDMGLEGLMIWPSPGDANIEFYRTLYDKLPVVFIDRTFDELPIPGVTIDWSHLGSDIVQYLARKGMRSVLMLENPLAVSSYRRMYAEMRKTIQTISAEDRFEFVEFDTESFFDSDCDDPVSITERLRDRLGKILAAKHYDSFFFTHDELIDSVYACTDLAMKYPMQQIVSLTNTNPRRRSIPFYQLRCREWVFDFEAMLRKATDMLHEIVFLNSRLHREVKIRAASTIRTSDRLFDAAPARRPDNAEEVMP